MILVETGTAKCDIIGIGISCGGPLDSRRGVVQSPPNLPGWDDVPAVAIVERATGLRAKLENDANACALAEWRFGAGRGTSDMVFLTFGTGLGAGIIANGRLLCGHSGMGGECGHIRIASSGPAWCQTEADLPSVSAKTIGDAADRGDADAVAVYEESGRRLGEGLSILIDILNPECIVIGSIFARSEHLLRPAMERVIAAEALPQSASVCRVVPAQLGEAIGDIASLAIAAEM